MEPLERYTVEEHARWAGDWEPVRGQPLAMTPSPGIAHQRVSLRLARQLDEALEADRYRKVAEIGDGICSPGIEGRRVTVGGAAVWPGEG